MTEGSDDYLEKALSAAFALDEVDPERAVAAGGRPLEADSGGLPESVGRYVVEGIVGRGGTGLVFRARDQELGRSVAVKILHRHLASDAQMVARFAEEARVCGRLEHPGVVPVHEMGRTADGLPFFTMKLVEGETLSRRLAARRSLDESRLEYIAAFEKICQIVAYAHQRGMLHMDLKPANVLVGAFGEILVTDWGFAATSPNGSDGAPRTPEARPRVAGTPAYMSPEQAAGNTAAIGTHSDVFSLGAMLAVILTGSPPYLAETPNETLLAASRGWLDDGYRRLEASGADPTLIELAKRCLSAAPADRPNDAGAVAAAVGGYLRSLDERARSASIEAAEARAHAAAEKRRRKLVLVAATLVVSAIAVAVFAFLKSERERARRLREDDRLVAETAGRARLLYEGVRLHAVADPAAWEEPLAAAQLAADISRDRAVEATERHAVERLLADIGKGREAARRNHALRGDLHAILECYGDSRVVEIKDRDFETSFRRAGFELAEGDALAAVEAMRAHPLRTDIIAALDEWIHVRSIRHGREDAMRLRDLVDRVDDDAFRARARTADRKGRDALAEFAAAAESSAESAENFIFLAATLRRRGQGEAALRILETAQLRFPENYGLHHEVGTLRREGPQADLDESIRQFSMALALRPRSAHAFVDLGQVLFLAGRLDKAKACLEEAARVDPRYAPARHYLGLIEYRKGRHEAALAEIREALRIDPESAISYCALGLVHGDCGQARESLEAFKAAVRLEPNSPDTLLSYGQALIYSGRFEEALATFEKSREIAEKRGGRAPVMQSEAVRRTKDMIRAQRQLDQPAFSPDDVEDEARLMILGATAFHLGRFRVAADCLAPLFRKGVRETTAPFEILLTAAKSAVIASFDGGERALDYRRRGLDWYEECAAALETESLGKNPLLASSIDVLRRDALLAPVRDDDRLERLPTDEAARWRDVWSRLSGVVKKLRAG